MDEHPRSIGPYRILQRLGAGGMGVVYQAQHVETGEFAAVKTIQVPQAGQLSAIRREIHALARIRHPGIVRILDEGLEQGLPWYAMEFLQGHTLQRYAKELRNRIFGNSPVIPTNPIVMERDETNSQWWTQFLAAIGQAVDTNHAAGRGDVTAQQPSQNKLQSELRYVSDGILVDYTPLLTLVRRLCAPLAFLHSEGIVHRDLKPENVVIRPNGTPVIVDFGLIFKFWGKISREALELGGEGGTVAYVAPEQIRGELVDARADLYALGCILYELITGRPPFEGSSRDIIRQHLHTMPIPPIERMPFLPAKLNTVICKLLAKSPRERLGYADDVGAILADLGAGDGTIPTAPKSRAYLYRSGLAGRDDSLEVILGLVRRLNAGKGGLAFIGGESGVGKTRLAMEVGRSAEALEIRVLLGECPPPTPLEAVWQKEAQEPLVAFRRPLQAIADICQESGRDGTNILLGERGKVLALYEPTLRGLPGQDSYPEPVELPREAGRLRLFSYLAETFLALVTESNAQALLLVLDDLHWADDLTLRFIEFLVNGEWLDQKPILVLGTYRTEEVHESLRKTLAIAATHIQINRLNERAIGAMIGDMLALETLPQIFTHFLTRQSEGNPFFVAEYLRTAVTEGVLYRDSAGQWQVAEDGEAEAAELVYETLPLPTSIQELVGRRLNNLSKAALRLLEAAAVIGREVPSELALKMSRLATTDFFEATAEALRRQILEETGLGLLRFIHDKIREVAYTKLSIKQRKDLHLRAARVLEHGAMPDSYAAIARHYEAAGKKEKATKYFDMAGKFYAERLNHISAIECCNKLLELLPDMDYQRRIQIQHRATDSLTMTGDLENGIRICNESIHLASEIMNRPLLAESYRRLGILMEAKGEFEQVIQAQELAMEVAKELSDDRHIAESLNSIGRAHTETARFPDAISYHQQALDIGLRLRDKAIIGTSHGCIGIVHYYTHNYQEMINAHNQQLDIASVQNDRKMMLNALGNIGIAYMYIGSYTAALDYLQKSLDLSQEIGDRRNTAISFGNLAIIHHYLGNRQQSFEYLESALRIIERTGDRRNTSVMLGNLAAFHIRYHNFDDARRLLERAIDLGRKVGFKQGLCHYLISLADVQYQSSDLMAAAETVNEAEAIAQQVREDSVLFEVVLLREKIQLVRASSPEAKADAVRHLQALLQNWREDEQQARLFYEIFKLTGDAHSKGTALELHHRLYNETPNYKYRQIIDELSAGIGKEHGTQN